MTKFLSEGNIPLLRGKVDAKTDKGIFDIAVGDIEEALESINKGGGSIDPEKVAQIYATMESLGYFLPEPEEQVFDNINGTLLGEFAPADTLMGLKAALRRGNAKELYPIGHEFADTYDGNSNPLIVAHYLDSTNNLVYGGVEGAILIRKYVMPTSIIYGSKAVYDTSDIKAFLETTYLEKCSAELKLTISPITVPFWDGSKLVSLPNQKFFLMSNKETFGDATGKSNGEVFDYWKKKTGLSGVSNNPNNGRIVTDNSGKATAAWLRTAYSAQALSAWIIWTDGRIFDGGSTANYGVLPACFIGKN